jgi:hypothetical protein
MEDFLNMSNGVSVSNRKKLQDLLVTIQKQIQRGINITHQLNRFSHEPEEFIREIDLSDITGYFVGLTQRFARLRQVILTFGDTNRSYKIITHPFRLHMALFAGLECCLQRMPEGGQITLIPLEKKGQYGIQMVCEAPQSQKPSFIQTLSKTDSWPSLQGLVTDLGGNVESDEHNRGFFIFFPKKRS